MPREHVYGATHTVRRGDLPALAARTAADLPVPRPPADGTSHHDPGLAPGPASARLADVHRRRYQLMAAFVDDLSRSYEPAELPGDLREAHRCLLDELARLRVAPADATDATDADREDPTDADPTNPADPDAELVTFQLRVGLGWVRDGGEVVLGLDGYDHDRVVHPDGRPEVDVGGLFVPLNWSAVNRLIRCLRTARDQAFGSPE